MKFSIPESSRAEAWLCIFSLLCHSCPEGEQLSCILFLTPCRWCILFSFTGCYSLLRHPRDFCASSAHDQLRMGKNHFYTSLPRKALLWTPPSSLAFRGKVLLPTELPVAHDLPFTLVIPVPVAFGFSLHMSPPLPLHSSSFTQTEALILQGSNAQLSQIWLCIIKVKVKVTQSCLTPCDPMDRSLPGSSIHDILQARIMEWAAILFSRGSGTEPKSPTLQVDSLLPEPPGKPKNTGVEESSRPWWYHHFLVSSRKN